MPNEHCQTIIDTQRKGVLKTEMKNSLLLHDLYFGQYLLLFKLMIFAF